MGKFTVTDLYCGRNSNLSSNSGKIQRVKITLIRAVGTNGIAKRFDVVGEFYTNIVDGVIDLAGHRYCTGSKVCNMAFEISLFTQEEIKQMLKPKMIFR